MLNEHEKLAERWLDPSEVVGKWIDILKEPAYKWRKIWRRLYVLTWPFSAILRLLIIILLIVVWLFVGMFGFFGARLAYIWRGERSLWD